MDAAKTKPSFRIPRFGFLGLILLGMLAALGFVIHTAFNLPPMDEIENPQSKLSTQLISSDGVVLQNYFTSEDRVNVRLNDISPHVIDGLIATEDLRFYWHDGVDANSMAALAFRFLRGTKSGGSTITMQLSRNLFDAVGKQRTISRKIREIIVSVIIERSFTKEEILAAYLNTVSIYGQTYGVEMAAQQLFEKSSKDLNIEESSTLVAMLKGQGVFNPYRNPDTVRYRRNVVINEMVENGFLDPTTVNLDSIKGLPLKVALRGQDHIKGLAPYFREHVRLYLRKWCSDNGYDLYNDGLKVYTTLDSKLQAHAEKAVRTHLSELQQQFSDQLEGIEPYREDSSILTVLVRQSDRYHLMKDAGKSDEEIYKAFHTPTEMEIFSWNGYIDTVMTPIDSVKLYSKILETGVVSIDPTNGQIKAWVGGIDFKHFKYDHVGYGKRQVGSTFKPFVYAAAIDNGRTPCDQEINQPVFFEVPSQENIGEMEAWIPKNSQNNVGGMMTLRRALATSQNLITARLMKQLGPKVVANYAYKLGIESKLEEVPSLCLGTTDLNVLELTGAYSSFVNKGQWIEPNFITRIEDRNGNVLDQFPPKTRQALSPDKAYMMIEMLKATVDQAGGSASRLRFKYNLRAEMGGKTGTTQEHSDGWFVGVTPTLVTGVWVGCSDRRMRFQTMDLGQGANTALPIYALYMKDAYDDEQLGLPQDPFVKPSSYNPNMYQCERFSYVDSIRMKMNNARSLQKKNPNDLEDFEDF